MEPQEGHRGRLVEALETEEPLSQPVDDDLGQTELLVHQGLEDQVLNRGVTGGAALEDGGGSVGVRERPAGQNRGNDFCLAEDWLFGLQEGEYESSEEGGGAVKGLGDRAGEVTGTSGS